MFLVKNTKVYKKLITIKYTKINRKDKRVKRKTCDGP